VHGLRAQLLAGAALGVQKDRDVDRHDLRERLVGGRECGDERAQARQRLGERVVVEIRGRDGRAGAKQPECLAELEHVAIDERRAFDALAVQDHAVAGAGIFDRPAASVAHEAGVRGRHRLVFDAQRERARVALDDARGCAADRDRIDTDERMTRAAGKWPIARQESEQDRCPNSRWIVGGAVDRCSARHDDPCILHGSPTT
jgi:hypothetical protein